MMKWRRQFSGEVAVDDAMLRADKLLRQYGFRKTGQLAFAAYERSEPWSWTYALRPRSIHATLNIWPEPMNGGISNFKVELETHNLTGNCPTLARYLLEGELKDLEAGMLHNLLPKTNRITQNRWAGANQLVLMTLTVIIALAMASPIWRMNPVVGYLAYLVFVFTGFYLLGYLKLPLLFLPDWPVRHAPGAVLVNPTRPESVPVAPVRRRT
jgi:hypothetical protein